MAFLGSLLLSISYLVHSGMGQMALYNRERPIQEVIDDERANERTRERLKWVKEVKGFVEETLSVKATTNYTTFVDLKRPYVIWAITVAEPAELKLKEWSFPFVGAFPYLGFFDEGKARARVSEYAAGGYDTYVRGVSAYSTLGYLRDPLLSSMLTSYKADLVNLIFHETMHSLVYLKSHGDFNEQVATYVGDYGERFWIGKTFGPESAQMREWADERDDRRKMGEMLKTFAGDLKAFYLNVKDVSAPQFKEEKERRFVEFQKRFETSNWKTKAMSKYSKHFTNNAALLAFLTYEDSQTVFDKLDQKCSGDYLKAVQYLRKFSADLEKKDTNNDPKNPQKALEISVERDGFSCAS